LPAPLLGITPAMPSVQPRSDRAISQALKPGQVIFGHRPEGHQVAHGREFTTDSNGENSRHEARPGGRRTADENQMTSAYCLGKVGPMPNLPRLHADHAPAVLAFELANRAYFAASISDRGDDFFAQFTGRYNALLAEQEAGTCAFYVLVAEDGSVLGRFNLVDIEDHTAELGYRVAQHVAGRGVATATVRELCRLAAARHGLRTLRAGTTRQNVASQKVLTKAGFVAVGPADPAHLGGKPGTWYQRDLVL